MRAKVMTIGTVVAALLASSCCWLPLLFAGLGATGVGIGFRMASYRPYWIATTAILLAGAWGITLRSLFRSPSRPRSSNHGEQCCNVGANCVAGSAHRRGSIAALTAVTLAAVAILLFPQIEAIISSNDPSHHFHSIPAPGTKKIEFQSRGLSCPSCAIRH